MGIKIYHTKSCAPCDDHIKNFRKVAKELGIDDSEVEVRDALENEEYKKVGIKTVPSTIIGDTLITGGMTQKEIKEALIKYKNGQRQDI